MVTPRIVPDSKPPPVLLLSLGATLLAGVIIRALRRRHSRAAGSRGVEVSSTGRRVRQPASSRPKRQGRALLPASTATSARVAGTESTVGVRS